MILSGRLSQILGLRTIAVFEALKGILVLIVGLALLRYIHRDLEQFAEDLVRNLHLNPASRIPQWFASAAGRVPDTQISTLITAAIIYAIVRFIEAYGLWRNRSWAEWFALVSCGVYLPVELFEFAKGPSAAKGALFLLNAAVVVFLWILLSNRRANALKSTGADKADAHFRIPGNPNSPGATLP
jgi:uncharacterized membrane protein (DUF2068 family)